MNKKIIFIFIILNLLFISGCEKNNDDVKIDEKENMQNQEIKKTDIDSLIFPLYKQVNGDYTYYVNNDIYVIESDNIVIDTINKMVIDFNKKELLDYDEFIKNNPLGDIRNFVVLNNRCRQEITCNDTFACQLGNYGIENLQEEIDPINGVTPDYLVQEWCPIEVSDDLIKQLDSIKDVRVIGKELPNMDNETIKNSLAIKIPEENKIKILKDLFYNYGLLDLYQYGVKGYTKYSLRSDICERMQLKCENKD